MDVLLVLLEEVNCLRKLLNGCGAVFLGVLDRSWAVFLSSLDSLGAVFLRILDGLRSILLGILDGRRSVLLPGGDCLGPILLCILHSLGKLAELGPAD